MTTASKLYDSASDTVHDWVDNVRQEMPDAKDLNKAASQANKVASHAAAELAGRAGDLWDDAADRIMTHLPGAAARAARTRRRRWMFGGVAVIGLVALFGPGGAQRRAALKRRFGQTADAANRATSDTPAKTASNTGAKKDSA